MEPEALDLALEDPFEDDGFTPGLRPRLHLDAAAFLAACDGEPEAAAPVAGAESDVQDLVFEALLRAEEPEDDDEAGLETEEGGFEDDVDPADAAWLDEPWLDEAWAEDARLTETCPAPADVAGPGSRATPRTAAARAGVAAFEITNRYQREVAGLLGAILGYLEGPLVQRGNARTIRRWWRVFAVYRRALEFPELAGPRAFEAFEKLSELEMPDLVKVARKGRLGRRMPHVKRQRRRKGGPRWIGR